MIGRLAQRDKHAERDRKFEFTIRFGDSVNYQVLPYCLNIAPKTLDLKITLVRQMMNGLKCKMFRDMHHLIIIKFPHIWHKRWPYTKRSVGLNEQEDFLPDYRLHSELKIDFIFQES